MESAPDAEGLFAFSLMLCFRRMIASWTVLLSWRQLRVFAILDKCCKLRPAAPTSLGSGPLHQLIPFDDISHMIPLYIFVTGVARRKLFSILVAAMKWMGTRIFISLLPWRWQLHSRFTVAFCSSLAKKLRCKPWYRSRGSISFWPVKITYPLLAPYFAILEVPYYSAPSQCSFSLSINVGILIFTLSYCCSVAIFLSPMTSSVRVTQFSKVNAGYKYIAPYTSL